MKYHKSYEIPTERGNDKPFGQLRLSLHDLYEAHYLLSSWMCGLNGNMEMWST